MGTEDAPAFINFVKEKTGQSKITWVGHSRGNCQALAGSSINPDFWDANVNLVVALAPVTNLQFVESAVLQKASGYWREIQLAAMHLGLYDVLDVNWWEREAEIQFCKKAMGMCEEFVRLAADSDPSVDNMDRFSEFLYDYPAGSSVEDLIYFAQDVNSDGFHYFDYGPIDNQKLYGWPTPPKIPLKDIKVPTALVSGSLDMLANPENVDWLVKNMAKATTSSGSPALVWHQEYELGHLSFTLAKDMTWFKEDVIALIGQYATNDASEQTFLQ